MKHCTLIPIKDQKAMHVRGVQSSSIYTIRAVMLCMSKVSKEVQNGPYTSLLITFLIFNRFSICKKFWKAET